MIRLALALVALAFVAGCPVTGDNYARTYARTYCAAMYLCVEDHESIEDNVLLGYNDEAECREEIEADWLGSSEYDAYEEGDREFDAEAADDCLEEADQVRDDSDCGTMTVNQYVGDSGILACLPGAIWVE